MPLYQNESFLDYRIETTKKIVSTSRRHQGFRPVLSVSDREEHVTGFIGIFHQSCVIKVFKGGFWFSTLFSFCPQLADFRLEQ